MDPIIYAHNDLDGKFACAVALKQYPTAKVCLVNHGDRWNSIDVRNRHVIIVDFSFPNMQALIESCAELTWIDHHKTAADTHKRIWKSDKIAGYRSLEFSGSMLTYAYFNNIPLADLKLHIEENKIPTVVQYVDKYDMWKFEQGDNIDAFCTTAYEIWKKPQDIDIESLIHGDMIILDFLSKGNLLLNSANNRVMYITSRERVIQIKTMSGAEIHIMFVNSTSDISRLGSYINLKCNCDMAAIYEIINGHVSVHLRSAKLNIEPLARKLGGGGHPGAASYKTKDSVEHVRDMLFTQIYCLY